MENLSSDDCKSKQAFETLSKREDFIAASKAEKFIGKSIIVQARPNSLQTIKGRLYCKQKSW